MFGAGGAALGFPIADPIVGLLITVAILFVLRDAAREIYHRRMDAVDPALVTRAEEIIATTPGVSRGGVGAAPLDPGTPCGPRWTLPRRSGDVGRRGPSGPRSTPSIG